MYNLPLLPGQYYHLYNHAVGGENLFRHTDNYLYFLKRYGDYIAPVARTYAYCLMPNHFHLLVQVRDETDLLPYVIQKHAVKPSLAPTPDYPTFVMQQFSNLFNSYAKAINRRFDRKGALFIDYMRRKEVTNEAYFTTLLAYIHRNPVHHAFCRSASDWPFSSLQSIISTKPTQLERQQVLDWFGGIEPYITFHQQHLTLPKGEDWEFGNS